MNLRSDRNLGVAMWVVRGLWLTGGTISSFAWAAGDHWWAIGIAVLTAAMIPLAGVVGWVFMPREPERTGSGAEIVSDSGPR